MSLMPGERNVVRRLVRMLGNEQSPGLRTVMLSILIRIHACVRQ
jgi:hypothetical protein